MVPVLLHNIEFATGQRPCSRKYFGCCHAHGRIYVLGGSANTLLNDMRSFSLSTESWRTEGNQEGMAGAQGDEASPRERGRFESGMKELDSLQARFGFSMCSYMDRFIVVFGGAGKYMTRLKRRETYDDLYIWDAANSDNVGPSSF